MAVQIGHLNGSGELVPEQTIGGTPLSLTRTRNQDDQSADESQWACVGFGQLPVVFTESDIGKQISLQIFLGTLGAGDPGTRELHIDSDNIIFPFSTTPIGPRIARGPTLTIMKISDQTSPL
jgi:hypothetical protein